MSVAPWKPGNTYVPGALCVPRSSAPPSVVSLEDPTCIDDTKWTLDSPLQIVTTNGYGGGGQVLLDSASTGATALDKAEISPLVAGQTISATCMVRHGTDDKDSSDAGMTIVWFKSDNSVISHSDGNGLPRLSSNDWQLLKVSGKAPDGASYARIGVTMRKSGSDNIAASHFSLSYTPQVTARATMYKATQDAPGKSGSTEPDWPPVGESVQDNEVTWEGVDIDRLVWQASPLLKSGDTEPDWPTTPGSAVHDGTIDWIATSPVITDPNCPNSKAVTIGANKVFAGDKDITRFCATNDATDWSTAQNAGYIPTGLYAIGETDVSALAIYRANLAAWTASSLQVWQIDPDPANMAFIDAVMGGTSYQRATQPIANDLQFLSNLGVRSVGVTATTGTMGGTDVGSPVDPLIRAALAAYNTALEGANPPAWDPIAIGYPNAAQNWYFFGDEAYVYALSTIAKVSAWQHYTFPFTVTDAAILNGQLYVRTTDNNLYVLDETQYTDDGTEYDVQVQFPWLQLGQPGVTQLLVGADAVIEQGAAGNDTFLSVGWDENNDSAFSPEIAISKDTLPGTVIPIPTAGPALSFKLRNASSASWEFSAITVYYNAMRPTS